MLLKDYFFERDFYRFALLLLHQFYYFLYLKYSNKPQIILSYCLMIKISIAEPVWVFISIVFEVLVDFEEVWQEINQIEQTMQLWLGLLEVVVVMWLIP